MVYKRQLLIVARMRTGREFQVEIPWLEGKELDWQSQGEPYRDYTGIWASPERPANVPSGQTAPFPLRNGKSNSSGESIHLRHCQQRFSTRARNAANFH